MKKDGRRFVEKGLVLSDEQKDALAALELVADVKHKSYAVQRVEGVTVEITGRGDSHILVLPNGGVLIDPDWEDLVALEAEIAEDVPALDEDDELEGLDEEIAAALADGPTEQG
jgi:hypothetical protein